MAGRLVAFRPNMRSELVDEILLLRSNIDLSRKLILDGEEIDDNAIETISLDDIDNQDEIENDDNDDGREILFHLECER